MGEGKGMLWVDGGGGGEVKGVGLFIGSILEFCRSPLRPLPGRAEHSARHSEFPGHIPAVCTVGFHFNMKTY